METPEQRIQRVVREEVAITPYDSRWPESFAQEKAFLLSCLPNELIRRVEHFGSTAVPGLAAKPIVDILVEGHFAEHWDRLLFRDYLIEHPRVAREYEQLKAQLVSASPRDRVAYTRGKTDFVVRVTEQAKREKKGVPMKVLSINVGLPRAVQYRGETVMTSIFKAPVAGRVRVRRLNIEGDQQSDLTVHGGTDKAVYAYPAEHYAFWREELPDVALPWGAFGENFTTEGLLEDTLHIGDSLRIGSAEFLVTQPRMPCFKLGIRFDRPDMVKRFLRSGRPGFYLSVSQEGEVGAGDPITLASRDPSAMTVTEDFGRRSDPGRR
jgi:MOSC domain-containing protein YiiM/GrpB-like predicted nucleotidyltransferase (UPF0157 family)